MVVIGVALLFFIVGALMWAFVDPARYPKLVEAGKTLFLAGAIALAFNSGVYLTTVLH